MASFLNQAEPFQESQGGSSVGSPTSPDALKAFYAEMEQKELAERKASRGKTTSAKPGFWSRRTSFRKQSVPANAPISTASMEKLPSATEVTPPRAAGTESIVEEGKEALDDVPFMSPRSIIPDPLGELPSWFGKEGEPPASDPSSYYRARYRIHNAAGPRWYKNHHLIPPSQRRTGSRPPSVFSPVFPPMAHSTHGSTEDMQQSATANRSPSGSPMHTPNSSQTRLADGGAGKVRTRKTSQTAHDSVDKLDVTDPWGTNWHHQSPYDPGLASHPVSVDVQEPSLPPPNNNSRTRLSSQTATRHKSVNPSPLSQSTSAVHLSPPEPANVPRRLSKRRKPVLAGLFTGAGKEEESATSDAVHPQRSNPPSAKPDDAPSAAKRHSHVPPSSTPIVIPPSATVRSASVLDKRDKRGSVLGRLAKKFSLARKPAPGLGHPIGEDWQQIGANGQSKRQSKAHMQSAPVRPGGLESKHSSDLSKRVPPPSVEPERSQDTGGSRTRPDGDRASSVSVEAPYQIGKLTVANPDSPSSRGDSPPARQMSLPPTVNASSGGHAYHRPDDEELVPPPRIRAEPDSNSPHSSTMPEIQGEHPASPQMPLSPMTIPDELSESTPMLTPMIPQAMTSFASFKANEPPQRHVEPVPPVPPPAPESKRETLRPFPTADESPVSRSSMIVNPGTPHVTHQTVAPASPAPPIPPAKDGPQELAPELPPRDVTSAKRVRDDPADLPPRDAPPALPPRDVPAKDAPPALPPRDVALAVPSREAAPARETPPSPARQVSAGSSQSTRGNEAPPVLPARNNAPPLPPREPPPASRDAPPPLPPRNERRPSRNDSPTKSRPAAQPVEAKPPAPPPREERKSSRNPSPIKTKPPTPPKDDHNHARSTSSVKRRETETFKLVRSPSDQGRSDGVTITAGGEQWEVVGAEAPRRSKTREASSSSRDREMGSRSEHRRQERSDESEVEHRRAKSQVRHRSVQEQLADHVAPVKSSRSSRARSLDVPRPVPHGGRDRTMTSSNGHAVHADVHKPQPATPSGAHLERRTSTSTRPTSEVPSTAELNAMRAREQWEMDRLWKGRSMYGAQGNPLPNGAQAPNAHPQMMSANYRGDDLGSRSIGHGSSHTSYVVQNSFQGQPVVPRSHNIYYSGRSPVYHSTSSLQQYYPNGSSYDYSHINHPQQDVFYSEDMHYPHVTGRPANPLPPPPRESSYRPPPVPEHKGGRNSDYWTKYTSVTTAH